MNYSLLKLSLREGVAPGSVSYGEAVYLMALDGASGREIRQCAAIRDCRAEVPSGGLSVPSGAVFEASSAQHLRVPPLFGMPLHKLRQLSRVVRTCQERVRQQTFR